MEQEQTGKFKFKKVLKAACQAVETFFYVFFMMEPMIVYVTALESGYWLMPLFVVPSCLVCLTIAADYWVGKSRIRLRAFWISNIVAAVILVPICLYYMPYNVAFPLLRIVIAVLLPIGTTLYGVIKAKKAKAKNQNAVTDESARQLSKTRKALKKASQIVCLLGICCVLLENTHRAIVNGYQLITVPDVFIVLPGRFTFPLAILTAILLARFVKAEFAPREISAD